MTGVDLRHVDVPRAAGASDVSRAAGRVRLDSIDLLRGLVMVLMALDHTRDFFGASGPNPRDIADPALFLTRWVTHFCAPTFIFLAGVSAFLYGERGRSVGEVSLFLLTRGLWLILIEFTLMRFCWTFSFQINVFVMQVIWVTGASMVVLAGLVHLPRGVIAAIGLAMIAGHNLLDGIDAADLGNAAWLWTLLHQPGLIEIGPQIKLFVLYNLVPWSGVMAAGYALGPVYRLDPVSRRSFLIRTGAAVTAAFVVLRATNLYGDGCMEHAKHLPRHGAVVHRLRKVSAVAAASDDDARTRADPACAVRARAWRDRRRHHHVRARAVLLLRGARRVHPCAGRGVRLGRGGRRRLDVRLVSLAKARELRAQPLGRLRRLALRRGGALSALPRLCGAQATAARLVVELSLRRWIAARACGTRSLDQIKTGEKSPNARSFVLDA
jgi:uncharacterized membrane protein